MTATDGDHAGGGVVDRFRIKITGGSGVLYDNHRGGPDDIDHADPQALQSGSIMIHRA